MSRPYLLAAALPVCLALLLASLVVQPADATTSRSSAELSLESLLVDHHSSVRASPGSWGVGGAAVAAIPGWTDIRAVARNWSDRMAAGACPGGATICHNTTANGGPGYAETICCWSSIGENIAAVTFASTTSTPADAELRRAARRLMQMWVDSDRHLQTLRNPGWDDLGIGVSITTRNVGSGRWSHQVRAVVDFRDRARTPDVGRWYQGPPPPRPAVTIRTIDRACPRDRTPDARFSDADFGALGAAVDCAVWWEVMAGYPDHEFRPERTLTRSQLAVALVRSLDAVGVPLPATSVDHFDDDDADPNEDAIDRLAAAGAVGGVSQHTFDPRAPVTRAQMATFLSRGWEQLTGSPLRSGTDYFYDDDHGMHEAAANGLAGAGIAGGIQIGLFDVGGLVTRGQLARFLSRWLDHAVAQGHAVPPDRR